MGKGFTRKKMERGEMASDVDDFTIFGPSHLTSIDWTNSYHRTSVASSLVNGVYILEDDRRKNREGSESLAKPWWESFDFTLHETLMDDDSSIYGAVFKYKHTKDLKAPCYVIAFRGTVIKKSSWRSDMKLNLKIIFNSLHRGGRSMYALNAIRNMVDKHNGSHIWLAGHSLGAALVLLAGKTMTRSGCLLESYIFNPPISSIPFEQLPGGDIIKGVFQFGKSVVKATVIALTDLKVEKDDPKLASWIPYLYVNPADPICAGYIDYFKLKAFMSEIGESQMERISAKISVRNLLFERKGKSSTSDFSKEPLHLLASADMTVNKNKSTESIGPHDLQQWWQRDSALEQMWESVCIRPESPDESEELKQLTGWPESPDESGELKQLTGEPT